MSKKNLFLASENFKFMEPKQLIQLKYTEAESRLLNIVAECLCKIRQWQISSIEVSLVKGD